MVFILLQSLNIFLQALHILVSKLIQCQFHAYQFFADSSQAIYDFKVAYRSFFIVFHPLAAPGKVIPRSFTR